ncbi:non-specific lipid transfer protein GPI-anchored 1 [Argentina anserina]|uniref:non-specific lipid transfer protein GPI-anchored 1 n=1 Tax=Argentina anserina TaxID=57926 RepID=UPI0021767A80|nr:non-specific lipid transfer protein GPI-anchored 1 [Potentilla anserina]
MEKMLMCLAVVTMLVWGSAGAAETVAQKCSDQFQKVAVCLTYATGKAATPTKECCESVKGLKETEPECLCYVIQQAGSGSDQIKKMGIQVAKLLQLPTACSLKDANASNCPALLGLAPNSPDAAIFTNGTTTSTATPSSNSTTISGQSAPDTATAASNGVKLGPGYAGLAAAVAVPIVFLAFSPAGGFVRL